MLADRLADAGVRYAALTDHDTVEGQARFREAMEARGIPTLPGLELTTELDGRLAHLLAYGFEPVASRSSWPRWRAMRYGRDVDYHSIAASLRAAGRGERPAPPTARRPWPVSENGQPAIADAIALIHRAGGRAFLAHPLVLEPDLGALETLLPRLKALGLDGIEADLRRVQHRAAGGADRPGPQARPADVRRHRLPRHRGPGKPRARHRACRSDEWLRFRAAVLDSPTLAQRPTASDVSDPAAVERDQRRGRSALGVAPSSCASCCRRSRPWGSSSSPCGASSCPRSSRRSWSASAR